MTGLASSRWAPVVTRFVALCAFALWQGGFVFYAGVVVPISSQELGDTMQGFITRQVTLRLNWVGLIALAFLLADHLTRPIAGDKHKVFWALWALMLLCQITLMVLHPMMDNLLEPETISVLDRRAFRQLHRNYLWTSTAMWVASLGWAWLVAGEWRIGEAKEKPRA